MHDLCTNLQIFSRLCPCVAQLTASSTFPSKIRGTGTVTQRATNCPATGGTGTPTICSQILSEICTRRRFLSNCLALTQQQKRMTNCSAACGLCHDENRLDVQAGHAHCVVLVRSTYRCPFPFLLAVPSVSAAGSSAPPEYAHTPSLRSTCRSLHGVCSCIFSSIRTSIRRAYHFAITDVNAMALYPRMHFDSSAAGFLMNTSCTMLQALGAGQHPRNLALKQSVIAPRATP